MIAAGRPLGGGAIALGSLRIDGGERHGGVREGRDRQTVPGRERLTVPSRLGSLGTADKEALAAGGEPGRDLVVGQPEPLGELGIGRRPATGS